MSPSLQDRHNDPAELRPKNPILYDILYEHRHERVGTDSLCPFPFRGYPQGFHSFIHNFT